MKIIIAGCGIVGTALASRLAVNKHNVTIVDIDERNINYIQNIIDVMCILGDATSPEVLEEANVKNSDLFIAVTDSDEENLLACLIAKKMGVKNTIARVRENQNVVAANLLKDEMGLSMLINPESDAAREIFNSLKYKPVGKVETIAKGSTEIITCRVNAGSKVCGELIKNIAHVTGTKVLICGIKRDGVVFIPTADTEIRANDTLSFAATTKDTLAFLKKLGYDMERTKNIVIIGGSKLAVSLAKRVIETGVPVKIIDHSEANCKKLLNLVPEAEVICGDGTDADLLQEEGVLESSVIVAATDDDATNTMEALYLSKMAPKSKIIIKIKKSDFEELLFNMNIGSIYNPKYITVDNISRYVKAMQESMKDDVVSMCRVIDNKVLILEFNIEEGMPNLNKQLLNIRFKDNLLIAVIYRDGRPFFPGGQDEIHAGDIVIVATMNENISSYRDIFA